MAFGKLAPEARGPCYARLDIEMLKYKIASRQRASWAINTRAEA